jgi:hypothetical protein
MINRFIGIVCIQVSVIYRHIIIPHDARQIMGRKIRIGQYQSIGSGNCPGFILMIITVLQTKSLRIIIVKGAFGESARKRQSPKHSQIWLPVP